MSAFDELAWRGMLQDATEGAADHVASGPRVAYIGFDPTASSLHVGSLLQIMVLVHLQRAGHQPIALVGGATGLVGDPSGKAEERQLLTRDEAHANAEGIRAQLEHFLDFEVGSNPALMRNNLDWLGATGVLDFLRDTGKYFSVNAMLRRESVRRRLEDEESGISFTEFAYQLLQAADFLHLHEADCCTLQMGGSDQWGNITAGIELIRRARTQPAFGAVAPLVTTSSGTKFGKTEAGTIWLDPARTSPFRFYQFWINTEDGDASTHLRYFTLRSPEEIEALEAAMAEAPQHRAAQRALADEVTRKVHGEGGLAAAQRATEALFGGSLEGLGPDEIQDIFADVPSSSMPRDRFAGEGVGLLDLLAETGLASSRSDARRSVEGGGVYLNAVRLQDPAGRVRIEDAIDGRFLVLRKGKKSYHLVELLT